MMEKYPILKPNYFNIRIQILPLKCGFGIGYGIGRRYRPIWVSVVHVFTLNLLVTRPQNMRSVQCFVSDRVVLRLKTLLITSQQIRQQIIFVYLIFFSQLFSKNITIHNYFYHHEPQLSRAIGTTFLPFFDLPTYVPFGPIWKNLSIL